MVHSILSFVRPIIFCSTQIQFIVQDKDIPENVRVIDQNQNSLYKEYIFASVDVLIQLIFITAETQNFCKRTKQMIMMTKKKQKRNEMKWNTMKHHLNSNNDQWRSGKQMQRYWIHFYMKQN